MRALQPHQLGGVVAISIGDAGAQELAPGALLVDRRRQRHREPRLLQQPVPHELADRRPNEDLETAIKTSIDEMWTSAGQVPDSAKIMKALRRAIFLMYPEDRALALEERLHIGESLVKTIFIHAFMDVHTFEVDRIKKCCTHYALPDGRLMPGCAYNNLYRDRDPRFAAEIGAPKIWGKTSLPIAKG